MSEFTGLENGKLSGEAAENKIERGNRSKHHQTRFRYELKNLQKAGHKLANERDEDGQTFLEIIPGRLPQYRFYFTCPATFPTTAPTLIIKKLVASQTGSEGQYVEVPFKSEVIRFWNERCRIAMVVDEFLEAQQRYTLPVILGNLAKIFRPVFRVPVLVGLVSIVIISILVFVVANALSSESDSFKRITTDPELTRGIIINDITNNASTISVLEQGVARAGSTPTQTALAVELGKVQDSQATAIARATEVRGQQLTNSAKLLDYTVVTVLFVRTPTPEPVDEPVINEPQVPETTVQPPVPTATPEIPVATPEIITTTPELPTSTTSAPVVTTPAPAISEIPQTTSAPAATPVPQPTTNPATVPASTTATTTKPSTTVTTAPTTTVATPAPTTTQTNSSNTNTTPAPPVSPAKP